MTASTVWSCRAGTRPALRQYLGSAALQRQVARFWALGRPVGAICNGVLLLARAPDLFTAVGSW
ncbi:hypothetical protein ACFQ51_38840 [Streptomyces kaempferi]